jgi:hypothetical protein
MPEFERRKGSYISDQLMRAFAGILLAISMGLGAWALKGVHDQSVKHEGLGARHDAVCERVNRLENRTDSRFEKIDRKLEKISEKLDRLIQRQRGNP